MNVSSREMPLVMFGEDWGAHPSSSQHLAKELSRFHEITWVNSIGLRSPRFSFADIKRVMNKCAAMLRPAESKSSLQSSAWSPLVIDPVAIPFHGQGWVRKLNQKLLSSRLYESNRALASQKPILWLSLPSALPLLGKINECFSIYYCGDDFSALEGVDHDVVESLEQELVQQVDLIIVASENLSKKFPKEKTLFIPHGVADYFFEPAQQRPKDLPQGPVAGFYGSISGWIDQQLLIRAARKLPHWNFVIIGPQRCFVEHLKREPNIYLLGEKPHEELPNYVHHWQVSILPFKDNAQIRACNPLKLREYMAVGKPIVSTDFPALAPYRDWVSVIEHKVAVNPSQNAKADQFARAIEAAASDGLAPDHVIRDSEEVDFFAAINAWQDIEKIRGRRRRRIRQVNNQTWSARAQRIEEEITRRLNDMGH